MYLSDEWRRPAAILLAVRDIAGTGEHTIMIKCDHCACITAHTRVTAEFIDSLRAQAATVLKTREDIDRFSAVNRRGQGRWQQRTKLVFHNLIHTHRPIVNQ